LERGLRLQLHGVSDVAIAEPGAARFHILYGHGGQLTATSPDDQLFTSSNGSSSYGDSMVTGDFNHDGCADLAVGDPGDGSGRVSIFLGGRNGLAGDSLVLSNVTSTVGDNFDRHRIGGVDRRHRRRQGHDLRLLLVRLKHRRPVIDLRGLDGRQDHRRGPVDRHVIAVAGIDPYGDERLARLDLIELVPREALPGGRVERALAGPAYFQDEDADRLVDAVGRLQHRAGVRDVEDQPSGRLATFEQLRIRHADHRR
jgi:hypothetical protein